MKPVIRISALAALLLFGWYLVADRVTPFTANARVKAIVVPIVPQVSGYVSAVAVANAEMVEPGAVLVAIDERPFLLALDGARAELQIETQELGASSAEVELAQAQVAKAQSELGNVRLQAERVFGLEQKGLVAAARGDDARSKLSSAEAQLAAAQADLVRSREQLGVEGGDNPRIQAAVAGLGIAELKLEWTTLRAPSRGAIVDLNIDEGAYAKAGQPLLTFISMEDVWIEAYMTENNLGLVSVGDRVEVVLDIHPGRIFEGVVASFGGAAAAGR